MSISKELVKLMLQKEKNAADKDIEQQIAVLKRESITKPVITVGSGTCGMIAGANETFKAIEEYITDRGIDAQLQKAGCIGICSMEPVVEIHIPGKTRLFLKNLTEEKVNDAFDDAFHHIVPAEHTLMQIENGTLSAWPNVPTFNNIPFFALQNRIVLKNCGLINPYDIEQYLALGGYKAFIKTIRNYTAIQICDLVEESGLRGRSGGGYTTGKKWKTALFEQSEQKYLICNAEESDPGAFMDRAIIEGDPHRVIEGMAIAAYAIGATKAIVYIRSEYTIAIQTLETAIKQAKAAGLLGQDIQGSGFNFDVSIRKGPGAFVCGEETALISSIEGDRGMPETKPPFPAKQGLFNKPTVVNNVETLANVAEIISRGPSWFNAIGTEKSKGTKIFAISGKIHHTSLVEVAMGTTFRQIVFDIAGGIKDDKHFKAMLLGGPVGFCLSEKDLDLHIDFDILRNHGLGVGSGGLIILDENNCIIDTLKYYMDFMQYQSCGKCIPCREGTKRLFEILTRITHKPLNTDDNSTLERIKGIIQLEEIAQVMKATSLCGLGQSVVNPILSALDRFKQEFESHLYERKCEAWICKQLRTFTIDVDACTGCSLCARKCPTSAIIGSKRMPYFIIEEKCIGCGYCIEACKFDAVFVK